MTADYGFLSYYPHYGFQGLTSHYANPLAEFDRRAAAIESWSDLAGPEEFVKALDAALAAADGVPHAPRRRGWLG